MFSSPFSLFSREKGYIKVVYTKKYQDRGNDFPSSIDLPFQQSLNDRIKTVFTNEDAPWGGRDVVLFAVTGVKSKQGQIQLNVSNTTLSNSSVLGICEESSQVPQRFFPSALL